MDAAVELEDALHARLAVTDGLGEVAHAHAVTVAARCAARRPLLPLVVDAVATLVRRARQARVVVTRAAHTQRKLL